MYVGFNTLVVIPLLAVVSVHFCIAFVLLVFHAIFPVVLVLLQVQYFSSFVTYSICIFGERRLAGNGL